MAKEAARERTRRMMRSIVFGRFRLLHHDKCSRSLGAIHWQTGELLLQNEQWIVLRPL